MDKVALIFSQCVSVRVLLNQSVRVKENKTLSGAEEK